MSKPKLHNSFLVDQTSVNTTHTDQNLLCLNKINVLELSIAWPQ